MLGGEDEDGGGGASSMGVSVGVVGGVTMGVVASFAVDFLSLRLLFFLSGLGLRDEDDFFFLSGLELRDEDFFFFSGLELREEDFFLSFVLLVIGSLVAVVGSVAAEAAVSPSLGVRWLLKIYEESFAIVFYCSIVNVFVVFVE